MHHLAATVSVLHTATRPSLPSSVLSGMTSNDTHATLFCGHQSLLSLHAARWKFIEELTSPAWIQEGNLAWHQDGGWGGEAVVGLGGMNGDMYMYGRVPLLSI